MNLVCKTEMVHTVDYSNLEKFIQDETGVKNFEIISDLECSNNSAVRYVIDGKVDSYYADRFAKFKAGESVPYATQLIMNNLCAEGKLDAGIYVIKVYW